MILSIMISAFFVYLAVFRFSKSYFRAGEGLRDLWNSIRYYFFEVFDISHTVPATVENYSEVLNRNTVLPKEYENFKVVAKSFPALLLCKENFSDWSRLVGKTVSTFAEVFMVLLPCMMLLFLCIKRIYRKPNTNHNRDTKPLLLFKAIERSVWHPVMGYVKQYLCFVKKATPLVVAWGVLWALNLNLVSVALEFVAYCFYFAVTFRIATVYVQFCKLFIDLQVLFATMPRWCYLLVGVVIWNLVRQKIGTERLRHMEARNCGFINELPIVSMTCGSMGKKKTTVITDMALSQEVMFRQKALERLQKADMKFPHFPWICFERELRACIEHRAVYNLATAKEWVEKKQSRYEKHKNPAWQLYGYDVDRYGYTYCDCLTTETLFDVLKTYAELYFIYIIESSLLVSNYSIREDHLLLDEGNFPIWVSDFFAKDPMPESRYAHILDFDVLRLGRKVNEQNPKAGSFEFGVVVISEVGKERGNNLELKEVKRSTQKTNQKNDLFNSWLKMCRHSATVDHFPFIKVFTDEQRPESWGSDARDLCDIVHVIGSSEQRITLPFYTLEDMICEWTYDRFLSLYEDLRFLRGDNTLLVYLLKSLTAVLCHHNTRMYNRFGYVTAQIEKERGTLKGKVEKKKYYIMNRKIYSRRFSTDCFSDYFSDRAKQSHTGLNDYPAYASERADVSELKQQNSYFIGALYGDAGPDE